MNARHHTPRFLTAALVAAASLACGPSGQRAQLAVQLVDAPRDELAEIHVMVAALRAHSDEGGWSTLATFDPPQDVDLLKLAAPAEPMALALANLPSGKITQLRLLLAARSGNYVVPKGSTEQVALKVPSGYESGIKIHGPWTLDACTKTSITLDFDADKSIAYHQNAGGWILRPVIKALKAEAVETSCQEPPPGGDTGTPPSCEATCPEGLCVAGSCLGSIQTPCTVGTECASGVCDDTNHCAPGGTGAPCVADPECLSGICGPGGCSAGAATAPCRVPSDCATGACTGGACGAGTGKGAGQPCGAATECLSGACTNGVCEQGDLDKPCSAGSDCLSGSCAVGICVTTG